MVRIAIVYAAFMAGIVAIADMGFLPQLAEQIHRLPYCDKALHFTLYGILALVTNLALASGNRWPLWRAIVVGSAAVAIVATVEEYSNQFVAIRDCSLGDLAANYLGVLSLGVLPFVPRLLGSGEANDCEPSPPAAA